jgi:uncharacterized membrane protein YjfL (UPF0719 family)|tara:strand:+ start:793 stop:1311 length:519 start_codon:yes stop_codon:yes gene_type:complete
MNEKLALLSLIELISALSCGVFILYVTFRILRIYGSKKLGIDQYNTAYMVFIGAVLFSVGFTMSGIINPILSYFRIMSNRDISAVNLFLSFIATGGAYIIISYVLSILVISLGIGLYTFMTPLKEVQELKENNIGVSIVLAAIIIVLSLMCKDGIILLIESIVPYPELPMDL